MLRRTLGDISISSNLQARLLHGLTHARWIATTRGLAKMVSLESWCERNRAALLGVPLRDMELIERYVFGLFSLSTTDPGLA
jgi:hypothetical protein